jgi:16S rRNA C967 or C1407 C5-methylase (RsmB/RsmF family)
MLSLEAAAEQLRYRKDLLEMMVGIYGKRTAEVLQALKRAPRDYAVRVNTIKGSKLYGPGVLRTDSYRIGSRVYITDIYNHVVGSGLAVMPPKKTNEIVKGMAVDITESIYRLPPLRESRLYALGKIREQSLPAMVTSRELDPKPGETIVDMCAAPGGKSLHMAQLMGGKGKIYAFDHSEKRLETLKRDAEALGAGNIIVECRDSRFLKGDKPDIAADRVLVDPPCSALGVRPKLYEDCTLKEVQGAAGYQLQFLGAAKEVVIPGGTIVYSTCTLSIVENEGVVKHAIDSLGLELVGQQTTIGEPGFLDGTEAAQRFSPDKVEAPGYFIAKFRA